MAGCPRLAVFETWDAASLATSAISRLTFLITTHPKNPLT
jgi:hypothetical protein